MAGEGITIPLDVDDTRAKAKIGDLKRRSRDAGKEYARAGQTMARMGGPGGGVIGRALGGFSGGIGMGIAGATMAVGGLAVNAAMAASDRAVAQAKATQININRRADAREADRKDAVNRAAASVGKLSIQRKLETRFGKLTIGSEEGRFQISQLVNRTGIMPQEAADALIAGQDSKVNSLDIAKLVSTGEFDTQEAAEAIKTYGSATNALARKMRVTRKDATGMIESAAAFKSGGVGQAMLPGFLEDLKNVQYRTTAVAITENYNEESAGNKNMKALKKSTDAVIQSLEVGASYQNRAAQVMKDFAMLIGAGEGSEATKATNERRAQVNGD